MDNENNVSEPVESMDDYARELDASFKKINEGDVMTGTVIGITDDGVILDLKFYTDGIIDKENLSNDPDFNMNESVRIGDEITATVIKRDDGEGHIVLSKKEANDVLAWDKLKKMLEERTIVPVKISEVVNAGAIAYLEGIRAFIPVSKISNEYVEDLNEWKGRTVDVTVITADEEEKRLVLSGREVAMEKAAAELTKKVSKCEVGAVVTGTVETLMPYGAFVTLDNGLTGLVHISQICNERIKHPGVKLKEGQEVKAKIISTDNGKISLSIKALEPEEVIEAEEKEFEDDGSAVTGLAGLLKGIKL